MFNNNFIASYFSNSNLIMLMLLFVSLLNYYISDLYLFIYFFHLKNLVCFCLSFHLKYCMD
jgi:hypothetical protein